MCRLVGWVSRTPVTLRAVLGDAAVARLVHLSNVHADGWGAAWHDEHGGTAHTLSVRPAHDDPGFTELAATTASTAALVHLRLGTPGCGHGELSNHPFVDGPWAFAHNGAFEPLERIDELLPADARRPRGRTDTERYFLALRACMGRTGSVPEAVSAVQERMVRAGVSASSMNAMLLGPGVLHVISRHDADWQATTIPVWPADELASGAVLPPYFPMLYRESAELVVAVSSGIVSDQDGWSAIPNHAVLTVDTATRTTRLAYVPVARIATG